MRTNESAVCRCCGTRTNRWVDENFPECSHGCAEWVCDRTREERHHGRDDWGNEDDGKFW